jgi:hypothetical protein
MTISTTLYSSRSEEWPTPQQFFTSLNREFHFTLDPCATQDNAKCRRYFTKVQNGLQQEWTTHRVFCNPPYGRDIWKWLGSASRHREMAPSSCCSPMPAPTPVGSMIGSTGKLTKSGSLEGGSNSAMEVSPHPFLRLWPCIGLRLKRSDEYLTITPKSPRPPI